MRTQYNDTQLAQELQQLNRRVARLEQGTTLSKPTGELEHAVYQLLIQLGIPSRLCGFHYLKEAVLTASADYKVMRKVTTRLYPEIAAQYQTTASRVERGMRHAIEVAWERGDYDLQQIIFASSCSIEKGKPTNSEFICGLIEYLKHKT